MEFLLRKNRSHLFLVLFIKQNGTERKQWSSSRVYSHNVNNSFPNFGHNNSRFHSSISFVPHFKTECSACVCLCLFDYCAVYVCASTWFRVVCEMNKNSINKQRMNGRLRMVIIIVILIVANNI